MLRLIILCMLLVLYSCSINYHRGQSYEKEHDIENANIEYQRASVLYPSNDEYLEAFQRTTNQLIKRFQDRYTHQIQQKDFHIAYNILQRALALDDRNEFFNNEKQNWSEVLIVGQVQYDFTHASLKIPLSNNVDFVLQFNTPNSQKTLLALVDPKNGYFRVIDYLYKPSLNLTFLYSIASIGIGVNDQQILTNKYDDILRLVNLRTPLLIKVKGDFKKNNRALKTAVEYFPMDQLKLNATDYWNYNQPIEYAVEIKEDYASIESLYPIDYLPQIIYTKQNKILLDFGIYDVRQNQLNEWKLKRVFLEERAYLSRFENNIFFRPFLQTFDSALYLKSK